MVIKKIKIGVILLSLIILIGVLGVVSADDLPVNVDTSGRPDLVGMITTDGESVYFNIRAVGQANDGDDINPSKYYSQTNFDNEYFTIEANGKLLKYNMFSNPTPYWGTSWSDATNPLPDEVTFSQTEDGDDFVYDVSMSFAVLGVSEGDTFFVQIKARDFNDDYVESYDGFEGYDGEYSQYRGLYITDTGIFDATIPLPPVEVYVDDDDGTCGGNSPCYSMIQEGIDAVAAGGIVNVAAGTYNENIIIYKSLTVKGANAEIAATETRGSESVIDAQLANFGVYIYGEGTIATLDGFTVKNYEVVGVLAGSFSQAEEDPDEVHLQNNIVEAPSALIDAHNNNIQVGDGTTGTVIGNKVSGANLESEDWSGSCILVAGSSNVLISNNFAHDCEGGIVIVGYANYHDTPAVNNLIENNLVENCEAGISIEALAIDTIIKNNQIVTNTEVGVQVYAYDDLWGIETSVPTGTEVHYNEIVGNANGVVSGVWAGSNPTGIIAEVNGEYNWWGQETGPYHATTNPDGEGNEVSDNVDYDPWLYKSIEELNLPDEDGPEFGETTIEPQYPNCEDTSIGIFSEISDENGVHHARLFWKYSGMPEEDDPFEAPQFKQLEDSLWFTEIFMGEPRDEIEITYHIKATDNAGNIAWDFSQYQTLFTYDCLPPTTTDDAPDVWTNQDVTVTLTCVDTISDCKETYYSTDGSDSTTPYNNNPFTLSATGQYPLKYYSVDKAGNQESPIVEGTVVKIDKEVLTITDNYALDGIWTNADQTVTLTPSDTGGSEIKEVKYCLGEGCTPNTNIGDFGGGLKIRFYDSEGNLVKVPDWFLNTIELTFDVSQDTIVRYQAWDNAGNPSAIGEFNIKLDKEVPVTNDDYTYDNEWMNSNQIISLSVSDDGYSPITWTKYCLTLGCDPSTGIPYTGAVTISEEGTTYFRYSSRDDAGNVEIIHEKIVKIDKTLPTVWIDGDLPSDWQTGSVTLSVQCNDTLSDCKPTSYEIEEVPEGTDCSTVTYDGGENSFVANSHVYLCARAEDNSGNFGYSELIEVLIDNEKPSVEITSPTDPYDLIGDVEIFASATDSLSGVESVTFELKNSTDVLRSGSLTYDSISGKYRGMLTNALDLPVGTYTLEVVATDAVGNEKMDSITLNAVKYVLPEVVPLVSSVPFGENNTVEFEINFVIRGGNAVRMKMTDLSNGAVYTPEQLNARLVYNGAEYLVRNDYIGDKIILQSTPGGAVGTAVFKMDIQSYMVPGNYHADYQFEITEV